MKKLLVSLLGLAMNNCQVVLTPDTLLNRGEALESGDTLMPGQYLDSGNGYYGVMQPDGNFVVYEGEDWTKNAKWATGTNVVDTDTRRLVMQTDGNLVLLDQYNIVRWNSGTSKPNFREDKLKVKDDGFLGIYDENDELIWTNEPQKKN